ncbi:UNVERIFIED_CONTAM: hypothetical protein K2H54_062351 [Gekko kuhli]
MERRRGDLISPHGVEESLSLEQWEAQWKEFLRTMESHHSPWGILPLPGKLSPWEDARAFLAAFEQVAKACQWPQEEWVTQILPALSGEAEKSFKGLDVREDYGKEPLEEAGQDPSGSKQRHLLVGIKEEEDGEASLLEDLICSGEGLVT